MRGGVEEKKEGIGYKPQRIRPMSQLYLLNIRKCLATCPAQGE